MKDKEASPGRILTRGIENTLDKTRRRRRVTVTDQTVEIQIDAKQRARMAVRYPHLYTAPVDSMLEAIAEERAKAVGTIVAD